MHLCACVSKLSAYAKRHQGKQIAAACRESAIAAAKRLRIILQCGTSLCHTCRMLRVRSPQRIALLSIRRNYRYWYIHTCMYMCLCFCCCLCCTIYFTACNEIASHIAYTIRCRRRQQFSQAYANIQMYVDTMWHAHQGWLVGPFLDRSILFFFRLAWKYFKLSGNLFHFDCLVESLYNLHLNENTF